jgi:hypothetical protein
VVVDADRKLVVPKPLFQPRYGGLIRDIGPTDQLGWYPIRHQDLGHAALPGVKAPVPPCREHRRLIECLDALDSQPEPRRTGRVAVGHDHAGKIKNLRVDGQHGQVPSPVLEERVQHRVAGVQVEVGVVVQRVGAASDPDTLAGTVRLDL